jgi:hypothetical protein
MNLDKAPHKRNRPVAADQSIRMQRRKQVRVVTDLRVVDPLSSPTQPICILNLNLHWDIEVVSSLFIGKFKLGDVAELQRILLTEIGNQEVPAVDLQPLADPSESVRFFHRSGKVPLHSVHNRLEVRRQMLGAFQSALLGATSPHT